MLPSAVVPEEKYRDPLSPADPALPDLTFMLPDDVAAPTPDAIVTLPPVLADEVPPLKLMAPPNFSPLPAATLMCPPTPSDPVADPDCKLMRPPVISSSVLAPETRVILPPSPLSPLPTETVKAPDLPPVAAPVAKSRDPLLPLLVVPVLNTSLPETPLAPELAEFTNTDPDVVGVEYPPAI